ncbi:hypothetical protein Hypma_000522 [Hypsizygus marmoreus]|uniref:Uncharacterized protein n=1 Tax=Hypsizygus marmoreus TaxID=39966 RepID=A0A369J7Y8_HYPMA|nr:hypothetical protein Hypma_000522 [Hypsizygus marmoreus]
MLDTLLQSMKRAFSKLDILTLEKGDHGNATLSQLHRALATLSKHPCRETVISLDLGLDQHFQPPTADDPTFTATFQPLFHYPNLHSVTITVDWADNLDDAWLVDAGKPWPSLHELTV